MIMMMLINLFIMEFSIDILDISDRDILFPLPIPQKTVNLAKNIHILFYMLAITMAFSLPYSIFLAVFISIPAAITSFFYTILSLLFIFFIASIIFGTLINRFSGEKLKDIINWLQISSMLVAFIGFQIFNQFISTSIESIDFTQLSKLIYLFPPAWFAAAPSLINGSDFSFIALAMAIFAVLFSLAGYGYYLKKIAPSFERNLYKLTVSEKNLKKLKQPRSIRYSSMFKSSRFQALYQFSVLILNRERKLKQSIYPMLVMGLFFPILITFQSMTSDEFNPVNSKLYFSLYYLVMMIIPLTIYIRYSENYKAVWIYRFLPIKNPGEAIKAAYFAIFYSYQLPIIFIASLLFLIAWKFTIIPQVLAIALSSIIIQLIYQKMTDKIMPFSQELKTGQSTAFKQGSYLLTIFVFVPLLGGSHFVFTLFNGGIYIFLLLQLIIFFLLYRNHFNISWQEIEA